jgi:hypothetical protein
MTASNARVVLAPLASMPPTVRPDFTAVIAVVAVVAVR